MDQCERLDLAEERLVREANSLGALLDGLRQRWSPALINDTEWARLMERARAFPATMASCLFGFELPLHDARPRADLGVGLNSGSRSAASFCGAARPEDEDAEPCKRRLAALLATAQQPDSALCRVGGRRPHFMLEYDIGSAQGAAPDPGIFFYPMQDRVTAGGPAGEWPQDLGAAARSVAAAVGRPMDDRAGRRIEQLCLTMPPGASIGSVGAFPVRGADVRLAVMGFRRADKLAAFLDRAGWTGQRAVVADTASSMALLGAHGRVGLNIDVLADGLGARLGLSFYVDPWPWARRQWRGLLDYARHTGLAVPAKLDALGDALPPMDMLLGRSGSFQLLHGIHHVKFVVDAERITEIKAYDLLMLRPFLDRAAQPPGQDPVP